jgi:predicted phage tail protein
MATLRKIILTGELAKRFGREHTFSISTPGEAIRAMCANFRDFAKFLTESDKRGVAYRVTVDKSPLGELDNLHNPFSATIRIVPVITGGKSAFGQIILGAALIAASFFVPGLAFAVAGTTLASVAFGVGVSLVLGGVSQMLAPQPKAMQPSEKPENQPSYTFNGPVNTTAQGQCVPVGYGRLIVGSAVISAGLTSDQYVGT